MYKLIAFDIDGTLVDDRKNILPGTFSSIQKAMDAGIIVAICSGRPYYGTGRYARELGLAQRGGYVIAFNGGQIVSCRDENVIYNEVIFQEYYSEIVDFAKKENVTLMYYADKTVVSDNPDDIYLAITSKNNAMPIEKTDDILKSAGNHVNKFMMLAEGKKLSEVEKRFVEKMGDRVCAFRSEDFFLEIVPKGIDKAFGLRKLAEKLGISREEIMAFGDGYNDVGMIEYAGLGIAMKNSKPPVLEAADYVTLSNNEEGIQRALEKYVFCGAT